MAAKSNKTTAKLNAKIALFIKEAGDKSKYNEEQQKIYTAFTKTNGKPIRFQVVDCEGIILNVSIDPKTEVAKILNKHFYESNGMVKTEHILKMFDVMRSGVKSYNKGNYVYRKRFTMKGEVYFLVIKLFQNGKEAVLKSFYSNIGYK